MHHVPAEFPEPEDLRPIADVRIPLEAPELAIYRPSLREQQLAEICDLHDRAIYATRTRSCALPRRWYEPC